MKCKNNLALIQAERVNASAALKLAIKRGEYDQKDTHSLYLTELLCGMRSDVFRRKIRYIYKRDGKVHDLPLPYRPGMTVPKRGDKTAKGAPNQMIKGRKTDCSFDEISKVKRARISRIARGSLSAIDHGTEYQDRIRGTGMVTRSRASLTSSSRSIRR